MKNGLGLALLGLTALTLAGCNHSEMSMADMKAPEQREAETVLHEASPSFGVTANSANTGDSMLPMPRRDQCGGHTGLRVNFAQCAPHD